MKTAEIRLYEFNELNDDAKEKAIFEHKNFLDSTPVDYETEFEELEEYFKSHDEKEVIESIEANEYIFFSDGTLANCVTYTDGPKKGITEFIFKGEIFYI